MKAQKIEHGVNNYQICANCVMDTTDPDITFDELGICNYCRDYPNKKSIFIPAPKQRQQAINLMIETCKKLGINKKYDCIIGVSGGVDSTYVAYLLKQYGLRPLAVHLDNGWNSELAVKNIETVLNSLGIELHTFVLDWEMFRDLQVAFLRASTPDSEIPTDHAIGAVLRSLACEEGLPLIVGANLTSESVLPKAWSQGHSDWGYINNVCKKFGNKPLKKYPHYSVFKLIYLNRIKRLKFFTVLNYIDYDKEKAKKFLIDELGWRDYGGKHHESIYTKFFQAYILPTKFGYDKRRAHLSSLILAEQIDRFTALEELKKPPYDPAELIEHLDYIPKKLNLSSKEFSEIMNAPIRTYEEYSPKFPKLVLKIDNLFFNNLFKLRRKIIRKMKENN